MKLIPHVPGLSTAGAALFVARFGELIAVSEAGQLAMKEMLAARLLTFHNLYFYARLMEGVREAIACDRFTAYRKDFLAAYRGSRPECGE